VADFAHKVCVVTGAGSGIGRALSLALADQGALLAISDIDASTVAQTARIAASRGAEVEHYVLDVSDKAAVFVHADAVTERFGTVNLLVNNAGVAASGPFADMSLDDFEWLVGINFWGVVYGCKAFLPKLAESGDGHVVNISSILGMIAAPDLAAYSAAKFAVRGFSESLRQELLIARVPVGVSCVHPGGVKTGIARAARTGDQNADALAATFDRIAFTSPEKAAQIILRGVLRRRPRILVGPDAHGLELMERLLGARYQRLVAFASARVAH
jgi:NAD(P)-dependent dehydrogenase (short-subunit alcohol dehydrogenase family)